MYPKQLYYKKGRKYVEFQPPWTPTDLLYYQDNDGEFIPLCEETARWYIGRPVDGVWLVRDQGKSATHIGDFKITSSRIGLEQYREQILNAMIIALEKKENGSFNNNQIATYILENLTQMEILESGNFNENAVLFYVNWIYDRTGKSPASEQIEEFKKDSLEMIKIYIKKGYDFKDAFNKVVNGYSR
jgi:hypothetical protein